VLRPVIRPSSDTPMMRLALERAASKWTLDVVVALQCGPQRFSELRSATGASPQGLTRALRAMERDGLLTRTEIPGAVSRVDYELSPLGISLCDVVSTLREWAEANGGAVSQARDDYDSRGSVP
jgi:DNA-binding HxlR family transcriptional regulator